MKVKFEIPESLSRLYHSGRKMLPLALGMFGLGAVLNSIAFKLSAIPLPNFVPVEMLNEAHSNWMCVKILSYQADVIIGVLALLLIAAYIMEVRTDESNDTSSKVQETDA